MLADLPRFEDGRVLSTRNVDVILNQLELVYRELSAVDAVGELDTQGGSALMLVARAIEELRQLEQRTAVSVTAYMSPVVCDGTVGRPQYLIPQDVLGSLLETGFSVPQIANILSVSIRTARRRMTKYGLTIRAMYSMRSQQELDTVVCSIQQEFSLVVIAK